MNFLALKALIFIQLALLLLSSLNVFAYYDEAMSPAQPPSLSPTQPPTLAPPPRKRRPLQGLVYCNACNYNGPGNIRGHTPLSGAVLTTRCKPPSSTIRIAAATTDGEGFFKLKDTTDMPPGCTTTLSLSSKAKCNIPVTFRHPERTYFMMIPAGATFTRNLPCPI